MTVKKKIHQLLLSGEYGSLLRELPRSARAMARIAQTGPDPSLSQFGAPFNRPKSGGSFVQVGVQLSPVRKIVKPDASSGLFVFVNRKNDLDESVLSRLL
jgi:hypothetical protein